MTETVKEKQHNMHNKNFVIAWIALLIGAAMLVVTFLLPFASATGTYRERLLEYSDEIYAEELGMTCGDVVNISLFEYCRIYFAAGEMGLSEAAVVSAVIILIYAVMAVLTLLFSVLKKPIPVIIFDLLTFGIFSLLRFDFTDRGVLPSSNYHWGMASYVFYAGIIITIAGAIALLIARRKNKNLAKEQAQSVNGGNQDA